MQATIDAQVYFLPLAKAKAKDYEGKLEEHEQKLTSLRSEYADVSTRVANFAKKVDAHEKNMQETQGEVSTIRREATSYFKLVEEAVMEGAR